MRMVSSKPGQRIINAGLAFCLVLSSIAATAPLFLSENASAASGGTVLGTGFDYLQNWIDDRHAPATVSMDSSMLTMTVDGDTPQADLFYRTEGRKADLPVDSEFIKATLHVDPAWQDITGVRAGLWGVTAQAPLAYPIVEFSNRNETNDQLPGEARFQVWNTFLGGWTPINKPIMYGNDYEFEIVFNDETDKFDMFIDEVLVHSYTASYGAFGQVIFNQYNPHIPGNDYNVTWKNFVAGNYDGVPATTLEVKTGSGYAVDAIVSGAVGDKFVVRGQASDDNDLSRVYVQLNKSTGGRFGGTTVHLDGTNDDWSVKYEASDLGFVDGDEIRAHVSVTDTSGKTSSVGWTNFMLVNTTAPNVTWNLQPLPYYGIGDGFHVRPRTEEVGTTKSVYIDYVAPGSLVHTLTSEHKNFDTKSEYNQALWDSLAEGSHKFIAVFTDHAGNAATSESNSFIVDRTKPVVKVNLNREEYMESGDMVRSAAIPEIEATDANLDRIEVWKDGTKVTQWLATTTSRRAKINWLGEGTYVIKAYDKAGNQSDEFAVTIDNTAPSAPELVSPGNGMPINGTTPIDNDWSEVAETDHYIYESYNVDSSGNPIFMPARFGATYTESQTNSRTLTDGLQYFWRVKAVDAAGNESDWSQLWKTVVDNTAPTVPVISDPINEAFFNHTPILNKWGASTDGSGSGVAGYQVAYRYDDGHTFGGSTCTGLLIDGLPVSGCRDVNGIQRNHTPGPAEQGGVTTWVRVKDVAGNYSAWSDPVHYYYDATLPVIAIPDYTTSFNVFTPDVNVSDASSPLTYSWTQTSGPTTGVTISDFSITEPNFTVTEDGDYEFTLTVIDPAGNTASNPFSFTYISPPDEEVLAAVTQASSTPATPVVTPVSQTPTTGNGFINVAVAGDNATDVLGAQAQSPNEGEDEDENTTATDTFSAAAVTPANDQNNTLKLLGLAWYWWVPILASGGLGWLVFASMRRANEE